MDGPPTQASPGLTVSLSWGFTCREAEPCALHRWPHRTHLHGATLEGSSPKRTPGITVGDLPANKLSHARPHRAPRSHARVLRALQASVPASYCGYIPKAIVVASV